MCLNGVCLEPEIGSCTGKSELDSCSYSVFEDEEKCTTPRTGKGCEERGGTEYRDLYREEMSGSCKGALADSRKCAADASSVEARMHMHLSMYICMYQMCRWRQSVAVRLARQLA